MRDPADPSDLLGTRVLVVEDNDEHRFLLSSHLSKSGCAVTSTSSAEEAVLGFSTLDPHIVFIDVQMPGMSGFEFVEWLRLRDGPCPRIVTTSVLDPSDHPLGDAILEKPFSRARVSQILDDYVALRNG
jgi:CheY-like chemotaxis protein